MLLRCPSRQLRLQKVLLSSLMSSSSRQQSSSVIAERVSDNLSFLPASSTHYSPSSTHCGPSCVHVDTSQRPIVLIYAWLAAKSRHIHKFGKFYLGNGFDVLHIKVTARQILWPPLAQSVVSDIISFITSPARHRQPVLIHGFSVGGYLYGETLNHIISDPNITQSMTQRVRGQVFDSPVDFEGTPHGVGRALSNIRPIQLAIKSLLDAYMTLFHRQVMTHYRQSSQTFRQNPLQTPSLVLYSKADVVGTPGPIESLIATWRSLGVPVSCRCWETSRHVEHYLHDPVNYMYELKQFLVTVGLVDQHRQQSLDMPSSKL